MNPISRRVFLGGLLATAACAGGSDDAGDEGDTPDTSATGGGPEVTELPPDLAAVALPSNPFTLGVASGDPDDSSVVLWTRLALDPLAAGFDLPAEVTSVAVEVAADEAFGTIEQSGRFPLDDTGAGTVHAIVTGLDPATTYWYRFRIGAHTSAVGRTRTVPSDDDERAVALAVASCQRYGDGEWAAHRDIAAADVDLVVFLGDYIYEAESDAAVRPLPGAAASVATTLADYRGRYAIARLDPHLAAAHAAHPWVVTWDDHEVRNDYAGRESVPLERRQAAYLAWWEHQPTRLAPPIDGAMDIHRRFRLGSMVDLLVLDTRQHRSAPACGGGVVELGCDGLDASDRTVLGSAQEAWVAEQLTDEPARWTAVAQSVVMAPVDVFGRVNADAWDGYPAARDRLVDVLGPAHNRVVLSGDVHIQLVGDIPGRGGELAATELVTPSISSRPAEPFASAAALLPSVAANVQHAADRRGWLRCDVDADRWRATYREVVDPTDPASALVDGPSFEIVDGDPGARRV